MASPRRAAQDTDDSDQRAPELGLALGGGGARGLCHIGVLRVLEDLHIRPEVISGTSMGGLIGAFVAAGYTAEELTKIATDVRWRKLIDWNPLSRRLIDTDGLEHWMRQLLPATFEELELPLVLTATDITEGRIHYSQDGDLIRALRATTAYPGAIEPVRIGRARLVDGGLLNQIPVDGALMLGAHRVLAVDATPLIELDHPAEDSGEARRRPRAGALRELLRAVDVMQAQLTMARLSFYKADLVLDPWIEGVEITDFHKAGEAIRAGEESARTREADLRALVR